MPLAYGDYFDGIKCNQEIPKLKHPDIVFFDNTFVFTWYKSNKNQETIAGIEPKYTNYVFWNDRFFGKFYSIAGKDKIDHVLNYFRNKFKQVNKNDTENGVSKNPIERKDGSWIFEGPDEVVIVRRYALHLGRIEIVCKDRWEMVKDLNIPFYNH